jgi:D-alanine-D-alanine ligase
MVKVQENKIRVAVLMGGPSSEHEVSLASAKNVIAAIAKKKYLVKPILIDKHGFWALDHYKKDPRRALKNVDVVFNALHGEYGEDGEVQGILERLRIKFTGSKQLSSALAMDKIASRKLFEIAGLNTPKSRALRRDYFLSHRWIISQTKQAFSLPLVIKPARRGSSVGISIIKTFSELGQAIEKAFKFDNLALIEEYLPGREITCGVLEIKNQITPLPPTEITPRKSRYFDYDSKYNAGWTEEITPASLPHQLTTTVQEIAVRTHKILGCRHYSRTDMILVGDKIYVLELNTLPGLTKTSLIPQQASAYGMNFAEFIEHVLTLALHSK